MKRFAKQFEVENSSEFKRKLLQFTQQLFFQRRVFEAMACPDQSCYSRNLMNQAEEAEAYFVGSFRIECK